jgi:site-specific DNA-methyltransferase (adenine-specific)
MRGWPDGFVDMIWTDPPYGHGNHDGDLNSGLNKHRGLKDKPIANDSPEMMRSVVDGMLSEAARILNPDCCCCCCCCGGGGGPRPTFAWLADRMDRQGMSFFHSTIWDKINPGLGWRYRRQHEMVMVAHRDKARLLWAEDDKAIPNIMRYSKPRDTEHPNEKPVELPGKFLSAHAKPGQIVLDPFCGSGSTLLAAERLGLKWIGIELEPKYVAIAQARIDAEMAQGKLF